MLKKMSNKTTMMSELTKKEMNPIRGGGCKAKCLGECAYEASLVAGSGTSQAGLAIVI